MSTIVSSTNSRPTHFVEIREAVGILAGTLGIASFVPQVLEACKATRTVVPVSMWFLVLLFLSIATWFVHGLLLYLWREPGDEDTGKSVMVINGIVMGLLLFVIIRTWHVRNRK